MGIGYNIKEFLKIKGKTIKWLAEETGISVNTLYSITKRDSERINIDSLNKIAKCLEVPAEALADINLLFISDSEESDTKKPMIQRKHLVGKEEEELYQSEDLKNASKLFDALGYKTIENKNGICWFAHRTSPQDVSFSMSEEDVTIFYEIIVSYAMYLENRFLGAAGEMSKEEKLNEMFKWIKVNREMLWERPDKEGNKD